MYEIIITQPNKTAMRGKLVPGAYQVGSGPDCHIRLPGPEIAAAHATLIITNEETVKVVDLNSPGGTYLDRRRLASGATAEAGIGTTISFGSYAILLRGPVTASPTGAVAAPAPDGAPGELPQPDVASSRSDRNPAGHVPIPMLKISGIPPAARSVVQEIKKHAHVELLKRLNLKRMSISGASESELAERAKATIREIVGELSVPLPSGVSNARIEQEMIQEAIGLGPLEYLIPMDDITEIMVNGPDRIYVERNGVIYRTDTAFADDHQVMAAIERIVSPLGRRIDESSPMVDARLPDGSRVNAIIPPLSLVGPSITIRKFAHNPYRIDDLIRFGSLNRDIADFLRTCVRIRKNIIISGGTGSGKTTLLNVLSSFLPNRERIITIEDAAELQLHQEHLVRLEARPPNIEGKGEISIRDLVRNSLRMRPDRIVVGECRGGEALDMLQAMNTGHDGSLTTIHANSPRDALSRLETLVLMAGFDLPLRAIREQIASAITIVVQIARERDGSRKVTQVSEITKMEGDIITMQDLFVYKHEGWDENDNMVGRHVPTGSVPTFMEEIRRAKLELDIGIFSPAPEPTEARHG
ncbi:MAG: ATPase, T2SS/T4P/T4SS family [Victivallales bacterium]|nr:ATPase, T2SS/T4P/T4SS family [Victivallales bacterium]